MNKRKKRKLVPLYIADLGRVTAGATTGLNSEEATTNFFGEELGNI